MTNKADPQREALVMARAALDAVVPGLDYIQRNHSIYGVGERKIEACRASIAAIDAALAAPGGGGWLSIETAPKDGTRILIDFGDRRPDLGVHAVAYVTSQSGWCAWCVDDNKHGPFALRGWIEEDIRGWRPLPTRPTPTQDGGDG